MVIITFALDQKVPDVATISSDAYRAQNAENLGRPHYSYQFVLETFKPLLERVGCVVSVRHPEEEVDAVYALCEHENEPCVFLSFTPPQRTQTSFRCPTIPVFAWEFADIPTERWRDERDDWRTVFSAVGRAITHSGFAAQAVRREMGEDFAILSCPAPVYDRYAETKGPDDYLSTRHVALGRETSVIDVCSPALRARAAPGSFLASASIDIEDLLERQRSEDRRSLLLEGVVYLAILNPVDGRKNWRQILVDFWRAFRDEPDATLVFKFIHSDTRKCVIALEDAVYQLAPFDCRIVCITGYLEHELYASLISAATYAVNASAGEGQCLPLMESMSSGIPAIAPCHTAMTEYVNPGNAFIVDTYLDAAVWPQDTRGKYRTVSHRIIDDSLVQAFRQSYDTAVEDVPHYIEMRRNARDTMRRHCSDEKIEKNLRAFLQ